jgi:hypothetical protein
MLYALGLFSSPLLKEPMQDDALGNEHGVANGHHSVAASAMARPAMWWPSLAGRQKTRRWLPLIHIFPRLHAVHVGWRQGDRPMRAGLQSGWSLRWWRPWTSLPCWNVLFVWMACLMPKCSRKNHRSKSSGSKDGGTFISFSLLMLHFGTSDA